MGAFILGLLWLMLAAVVLAVKAVGVIILFFAGCALCAGCLIWLIVDALCR
ncbi:hypothetical protein [uncultured Mailhella sp.]|uniref:hypothetical protein n=1 Tax=uncultured Mailhella sp. TaxID=1981031 RepID=UPI0026073665|nr:hypothetical protein [uncultured Mailhella sp.]